MAQHSLTPSGIGRGLVDQDKELENHSLQWILTAFAALAFSVLCFYSQRKKQMYPRTGLKPVPEAGGWFPFVGHLIPFTRNPVKFFENCRAKYGETFIIRLGMSKVAVMAGRRLVQPYLRAGEDTVSVHTFLDRTCVSQLFSDIPKPLEIAIPFMRNAIFGITTRDCFINTLDGIIKTMVTTTMKDFQVGVKKDVELKDFVDRTLRPALFEAVFGIKPTPKIMAQFHSYINTGRNAIIISNFLPQWVMRWIGLNIVRPGRQRMVRMLVGEAEDYLAGKKKEISLLLRLALEHVPERLGRLMLPHEAIELLLSTYFVLEGNPIALSMQVMKEVSTHRKDIWTQIRQELKEAAQRGEDALENKTLQACILESARMNAGVLAINRTCFPTSVIGDYDVGNADQCALAGHLFFQGLEAEFKNPAEFRPERHLGSQPEPSHRGAFWFWGAGTHACPGRGLSLKIMKLYLGMIIQTFEFEVMSATKKIYNDLNITGNQLVYTRATLARNSLEE